MRKALRNRLPTLPSHDALRVNASPVPAGGATTRFCERCGGRLGTRGRSATASECSSCGCFVCSLCTSADGRCTTCIAAAGRADSSGREDAVRRQETPRPRPIPTRTAVAVVGAGALAVAILALASGTLPGAGSSGGSFQRVAGVTATPITAAGAATQPSESAGTAATGPGASSTGPTPAPTQQRIEAIASRVRAWPGAVGGTNLQVLASARNTTAHAVALDPDSSTYRVSDAKTGTVSTGRFTAALPVVLGPGETGYLAANVSTPLIEPTAHLVAEATIVGVPAELGPRALTLEVGRLHYSVDGVALEARVTNHSTATASNVVVGAVLLDGAGAPIAAVYGLAADGPLGAGRTDGLTIRSPASGPLDPGVVQRVVATAYELGG